MFDRQFPHVLIIAQKRQVWYNEKMKKVRAKIQTQYGMFDIVLEREDKHYMVSVPKRPDVVTFGRSLAHAKSMAKEAIEVSIEGDIIMRAERTGDIKLVRTPVRLS